MAHGADAALELADGGDAAEGGCDHVAMFESGDEAGTLFRVVAQPVKELGEAPLGTVNPAAPLDPFEAAGMGFGGDLLGFSVGTVIAPEVVVVERDKALTDGNDAGAGGVEGDGGDGAAVDAGGSQRVAGCGGQGSHLVGVGLGGEIGIFAAAVQGIRGRGGADGAFLAVDQGNANTESAEVNAGDDGHGRMLR